MVLLLYCLVAPMATLYFLEYSGKKGPPSDLKQVLVPKKAKQIGTYVFYVISGVLLMLGETQLLGLLGDCLLLTFGCMAAMSDAATRRVPNKLILAMLGAWLVLGLIQLAVNMDAGVRFMLEALAGFAVGGGLMLIIYFASRKGLGAGDVKFMAVAGLYLTHKWVLSVMLVGSIACLVTAVVMMIMKKIKMSDALPLIPFLYIGIVLTILAS